MYSEIKSCLKTVDKMNKNAYYIPIIIRKGYIVACRLVVGLAGKRLFGWLRKTVKRGAVVAKNKFLILHCGRNAC